MAYKVALVSLGCPKNLVDSEIMLGLLEREGFALVGERAEADAIIVNTCAFIGDAREEAVTAILEAGLFKTEGRARVLAVAGCMAERYKDEIIKEMPEVDVVLGTGSIQSVASIIKSHLDEETPPSIYCNLPESVEYLDNARKITDNKPYAYLKIAEGCDNHCTYCVIPKLRGRYKSRSIESVLREAAYLSDNGKPELVLVAQDVTRYGMDWAGEKKLVTLIRELSALEGVKRIRLLYCYPELIDDALIRELAQNPKLAPYLDIPIQHISNAMLKAMGRRGTGEAILTLLENLRERVPGITLRTSLITGFPGETEDDFSQMLAFVERGYFHNLGVFAYSREEDPPAYRMKGQIPKRVKESRRKKLMAVQRENVEKYNNSRTGKIYDTMVDGVAEDGIFYVGRTVMEAPEIDPVIYFTSPEPLETGSLVPVKMLCTDQYDLVGEAQIVLGEL